MTDTLQGGVVRLIDSPIRYMRARVSDRPRWIPAFFPVVVHLCATSMLGAIISARTEGPIRAGLAAAGQELPQLPAAIGPIVGIVTTVTSGLIIFWLLAAAVVVADIILSHSGQYRRLVELCAVSYWVPVLYMVPVVLVHAVLFDPEPLRISGSITLLEVQPIVNNYTATAGGSMQIVLLAVKNVFDLWLVALHAAALHVVSGISVGAACAVAIILSVVFVLVPAIL